MNIFKDIAQQLKVISILLIGFIVIVMSFSIHIEWSGNLSHLNRFIYLNRFFTDFFAFAAVFVFLFNIKLVGRWLASLFSFIFGLLYFVQSESYTTIGEFLPLIALENAEHADFLEIDNHVFSGFFWLLLLAAILIFCFKAGKSSFKASLIVSICLIIVSFAIKNDKHWLAPETYQARFEFYNSGRPNFKRVSPISELIETGQEFYRYQRRERFLANNADEITPKASQFAKDHLDYFGVVRENYPLIRTTNFEQPIELIDSQIDPTIKSQNKQDQLMNVIVFFMEGVSAELIQPYDYFFEGLTPNIEHFSKKALRVNNYFNHTYATYRGLGGQFCSILPVGRLLQQVDYYCLGHALSETGYDTRFMVSQSLERTDLDRIGLKSGFQNVDGSAEIVSLLGLPERTKDTIPDRLLIDGLIERLKEQEQNPSEQPFFISLYNLETHTGTKLDEDDTTYINQNGQEIEFLNTFHNLDKVFGTFWDYFENSTLVNNTIVIVTSDHATFPSREYARLIEGKGGWGHPIFVDEIPLLIHYPGLNSKLEFDAQSATSLNLAPTILHLAGIGKIQAPFWGESLFSDKLHIYAQMGGTETLMWFSDIYNAWHPVKNSTKDQVRTKDQIRVAKYEMVQYLQSLERSNHLWQRDNQEQ